MFRFLLIISLATVVISQIQCPIKDVCLDSTCPSGMICSTSLQSCICDDYIEYNQYDRINLTATVIDFHNIPTEDFEAPHPPTILLESILGSDDLPIFVNQSRFGYFFTPTEGVNMVSNITLHLDKSPEGIYTLNYLDYFPIDNMLYGNEGYQHNYFFTTRTFWMIDYKGGEYAYLRYDDGMLLYLNGHLIVNEPDLHYNSSTRLLIDDIAGDAGMVPGNTYKLHIFHMERHTSMSMFYIETDLLIHPPTCPQTCQNDEDCINGICHNFEKVCHCQTGWAGAYCDQELCWNVDCGDHGTCNPYNGTCACKEGWSGSKCQFRICNYHGQNNNNNGKDKDKCVCDQYYTGDECEKCVEGDSNGNKYICDNDDGKIKLIREDWYETYLSQHNCFRPGTNGNDCRCKKNGRNYTIVSNDDNYYQARIGSLIDRQFDSPEVITVSSGHKITGYLYLILLTFIYMM